MRIGVCGAAASMVLVLAGCFPSMVVEEDGAAAGGKVRASTEATSPGVAIDRYPEIPTALTLSEGEAQAAREALVKVDDFYGYAHRLLRSGGEDTEGLEDVATDGAEAELEEVARDFRDNGERLEHTPLLREKSVTEVELDPPAGTSIPFVAVEQCVDASQVRVSTKDDTTLAPPPETFVHKATVGKFGVGWRVTRLDVLEDTC